MSLTSTEGLCPSGASLFQLVLPSAFATSGLINLYPNIVAPLAALEIQVQSSLNVTQGLPKDGFPSDPPAVPSSLRSLLTAQERVTLWEIYRMH